MAAEIKKEIELEIAHVLFIDIVGYTTFSAHEQHARIKELNEIVRLSEQFSGRGVLSGFTLDYWQLSRDISSA